MNVCIAAPEDMPAILDLVCEVFAGEQGIPRELIPIPEEKEPCWWCMKQDGKPVATVALYREGDEWHMGRLAVSPTLRGCHAGTKLLAHAFRDVFSRDIDRFVAEARDTTVHILLKFGAEVTGPATEFFGSSITPIVLTKTACLQALERGGF
jgi:N-acetylglutamate synthase-like GNAT family acetyltransferase